MPVAKQAARIAAITAALTSPLAAQPAAPGGAFESDGVTIHYIVRGEGAPVLLVHGFAVSTEVNWAMHGILDSLASRYRVISPDLRGHGASDKPHRPEDYGIRFVEDLVRLLDHLGVERAHVVGYSMGAAITLRFLALHPERVASAVLGGGGWRPAGTPPPAALREWGAQIQRAARGELSVSEAMAGPLGIEWPPAIAAALDRNDPVALTAVLRGGTGPAVTEAELREVRAPVLVLFGERDSLVRADAERMAALLPTAEVVAIPGHDHFSVLGDPRLAQALLRFLERR